jgi:hypothetical protein
MGGIVEVAVTTAGVSVLEIKDAEGIQTGDGVDDAGIAAGFPSTSAREKPPRINNKEENATKRPSKISRTRRISFLFSRG